MISTLSISEIKAYQIYDSRGKPTVEVRMADNSGHVVHSAVPSGASTGIYEAVELRDKENKAFAGQGVFTAIKNINDIIAPALVQSGLDILDQKKVDQFICELDGTSNKSTISKLGANAILAVSMAICRLAAANTGIELFQYLKNLAGTTAAKLPLPFFNVINGGMHAGNKMAFQEFMIVPIYADTFTEAMRMGAETYQILKSIIKTRHGQDAINVGDEGGFAPDLSDPESCLDLIMTAIEMAGYKGKFGIALDVAASEFHCDEKPGYYNLDIKDQANIHPRIYNGSELANYFKRLSDKYPIISIEDPFDQDDFESWSLLRSMIPYSIQIVGDDLTVTNSARIRMAAERKACNSLLLKINQIGTITESLEAAKQAFSNGWTVMVSHRSGETEDSFISDLATALACGQIKSGAPCRSERLAKYNRLLRLEDNYDLPLQKWAPK